MAGSKEKWKAGSKSTGNFKRGIGLALGFLATQSCLITSRFDVSWLKNRLKMPTDIDMRTEKLFWWQQVESLFIDTRNNATDVSDKISST